MQQRRKRHSTAPDSLAVLGVVILFASATGASAFGQRVIYVSVRATPAMPASPKRGEWTPENGKDVEGTVRKVAVLTNRLPVTDGTSWATAFNDLRDALAVAQAGDELWIAAGRYTPDGGTGDRTLAFEIPNGIQLYGGFAGWEWLRGQRDWTANESILSGDLNGDDGPPNCAEYSDCCSVHDDPGCDDLACEKIVCTLEPGCCSDQYPFLVNWGTFCALRAREECCDLGPRNSCENSISIADVSDTDSSTILDGLTVAGAYWSEAREEFPGRLGGLFAPRSGAIIRNCAFRENAAYSVIRNWQGDGVTIERTLFHDNASIGLDAWQNEPTVSECTFVRNSTGAFVADGVMWVTNSNFMENLGSVSGTRSSVRVENCEFVGNGGSVSVSGVANVLDCTFQDNSLAVRSSGGVAVLRNLEIRGGTGLVSTGSGVLVSNCLFAGATGRGVDVSGGTLVFENSTIIDNSDKGLTASDFTSTVLVRNSIIWGNRPTFAGSTEAAQAFFQLDDTVVTIENSIIEGWTGALGGTGSGLDPMFVDRLGPDGVAAKSGDGDYRLVPESPGIDAGTDLTDDLSFNYDLDRHPRRLCGPIDIGPYELGVGDLDCDDFVDLFDFSQWNNCMNGPAGDPLLESCVPFDFNADDAIDLADFAGFQRVFQAE
jgi:Right handed beta helix region